MKHVLAAIAVLFSLVVGVYIGELRMQVQEYKADESVRETQTILEDLDAVNINDTLNRALDQ